MTEIKNLSRSFRRCFCDIPVLHVQEMTESFFSFAPPTIYIVSNMHLLLFALIVIFHVAAHNVAAANIFH